jgi:hypothetical protein
MYSPTWEDREIAKIVEKIERRLENICGVVSTLMVIVLLVLFFLLFDYSTILLYIFLA